MLAACAAVQSSSTCRGPHDGCPSPAVLECQGRCGVPCDENQGVQPEGAGACVPGGRKASGGSHGSAIARKGGGSGGITAPPSSGVVVAPDALGPARAGPSSSGGWARRWRVPKGTPAAERSRLPPPAGRRVGGEAEVTGPGPSLQARRRPPPPEPVTRLDFVASEAPAPWSLHSQCGWLGTNSPCTSQPKHSWAAVRAA